MKTNSSMMTVVVAIAALVIGGGIGFYVGTMPQFNKGGSMRTFQAGQNGGQTGRAFRGQGQGGPGGNMMFTNRGVFGEIAALDDKSMTVKMPDGSSKIVLTSDTTTYENTAKASKTDVKVGQNVRVIGATNTDGSVTATSVMLNPTLPSPMPSTSPTTAQ